MVCRAISYELTWNDELLTALDDIEVSILGSKHSLGDIGIQELAAIDIMDLLISENKSISLESEIIETQRVLNSSLINSLDKARNLILKKTHYRNQSEREEQEFREAYHEIRKSLNISLGNLETSLNSHHELRYYKDKITDLHQSSIKKINEIQSQTSLAYIYN